MKRRDFLYAGALGMGSVGWMACSGNAVESTTQKTIPLKEDKAAPFFKLSLAQWSLNRAFREQGKDPMDFAKMAAGWGFEGIEYVNHLYASIYKEAKGNMGAVLKKMGDDLNIRAKDAGVQSLLIMVDGEGDLATSDPKKRAEAINNHHKWIDMAQQLGCHSIRVNLLGDGGKEEMMEHSSSSLTKLCEYAKTGNVNVLVENHGGYSSDPQWLTMVMKNVGMKNVGTLPDFGNFCIKREGGERWGAPCVEEYPDYYEAVKMMMPYAKAVSAKSYAFNEKGEETKIDYHKMMKVVKEAGYKGFVGVEFEGEAAEEEGILATKNLLLKTSKS